MKKAAIFSILILAMSLLLFRLAFAECTGPGKERWPIKTSVPEGANINRGKPIPLPALLALEDPPGVTKNDSRYDSRLIPPFPNQLQVKEGDIVSTTGWLHLVSTEENDCDYHIQISASPSDGNNCLIVEIPKEEENFIAAPALRKLAAQARAFVRNRLLKGQEPSLHGSVMQHPPFVRVTGQLFYDAAHVGDPPRGTKKMKAATLWELHPVTGIVFAPPPK